MSAAPAELDDFRDLIARVRAGDAAAAETLVRTYEPQIRRVVRVRLTDPKLRQVVDSIDICQSVMGNFFVRAALGQFQLQSPEQLLKLLVAMAQNRLKDWARWGHAERRDQRRNVRIDAINEEELTGAHSDHEPAELAASRELLAEFQRRMSDGERHIASQRAAGVAWSQIAHGLGDKPDNVRMRFFRGIDRIAQELGLDADGSSSLPAEEL